MAFTIYWFHSLPAMSTVESAQQEARAYVGGGKPFVFKVNTCLTKSVEVRGSARKLGRCEIRCGTSMEGEKWQV